MESKHLEDIKKAESHLRAVKLISKELLSEILNYRVVDIVRLSDNDKIIHYKGNKSLFWDKVSDIAEKSIKWAKEKDIEIKSTTPKKIFIICEDLLEQE